MIVYWSIYQRMPGTILSVYSFTGKKRGFICLSPERMQNLFHREQELPQGGVTKRKKEKKNHVKEIITCKE